MIRNKFRTWNNVRWETDEGVQAILTEGRRSSSQSVHSTEHLPSPFLLWTPCLALYLDSFDPRPFPLGAPVLDHQSHVRRRVLGHPFPLALGIRVLWRNSPGNWNFVFPKFQSLKVSKFFFPVGASVTWLSSRIQVLLVLSAWGWCDAGPDDAVRPVFLYCSGGMLKLGIDYIYSKQ